MKYQVEFVIKKDKKNNWQKQPTSKCCLLQNIGTVVLLAFFKLPIELSPAVTLKLREGHQHLISI